MRARSERSKTQRMLCHKKDRLDRPRRMAGFQKSNKMSFCFFLALLSMSIIRANGGGPLLSTREEQELLTIHNYLRSIVNPTATNMQRMEWSIELATVAQHYAEQCIFEHNPHRSDQVHLFSYVGENIAITNNPTPDYTQLVHGWYNESRYYDITTGECTDQECLHYTQMVWATSTSVGCGAHRCEETVGFLHPSSTILICNYGPGGSIAGERPYQIGVVPCSFCPRDKPFCLNNLCTDKLSVYHKH